MKSQFDLRFVRQEPPQYQNAVYPLVPLQRCKFTLHNEGFRIRNCRSLQCRNYNQLSHAIACSVVVSPLQ